MTEELSLVVKVNREIKTQLADESVQRALLATTFKGLKLESMKQALLEGMIRGFSFEDFLKKNIYAIPFAGSYSLITSVDHARKIGMKSGVVGKDAPTYTMKEGTNPDGKFAIESCTVTVKRMVNGYVGDYTATVFFDEYYKAGKNGYPSLWDSKPRTMIAKVAEMHALRMACPEELAQSYIEEELEKEAEIVGKPSRLAEVENIKKDSKLNMGNHKSDETTYEKDNSQADPEETPDSK
jgi:hypothetical protein